MSLPEVLLWQQLRKCPGGFKFRRQHAIEPYVVDFYCREAGLVVEVDGFGHDSTDAVIRDLRRERFLGERGLKVIRVAAAEVLLDAAAATQVILERARNPLHQPPAGPPPRSGED